MKRSEMRLSKAKTLSCCMLAARPKASGRMYGAPHSTLACTNRHLSSSVRGSDPKRRNLCRAISSKGCFEGDVGIFSLVRRDTPLFLARTGTRGTSSLLAQFFSSLSDWLMQIPSTHNGLPSTLSKSDVAAFSHGWPTSASEESISRMLFFAFMWYIGCFLTAKVARSPLK